MAAEAAEEAVTRPGAMQARQDGPVPAEAAAMRLADAARARRAAAATRRALAEAEVAAEAAETC